MKIAVTGNCQADGIAICLRAMLPDAEIFIATGAAVRRGLVDPSSALATSDFLLVQHPVHELFREGVAGASGTVIPYPVIAYNGFHPDVVHAFRPSGPVTSALGNNNSAITLYAWTQGLSEEACLNLFRADVYQAIGYFDYKSKADADLRQSFANYDLDLEISALSRNFMHIHLHPKLEILAQITRGLVRKMGVPARLQWPEFYLRDPMFVSVVWPVYPEIAQSLGFISEYVFKGKDAQGGRLGLISTLSLEEFIVESYRAYEQGSKEDISCERFKNPQFRQIDRFIGSQNLGAIEASSAEREQEATYKVICDEEKYDQ